MVRFWHFTGLVCAVAVLGLVSNAHAIILFPGDAGATNTPSNDVMGRWGDNASCVVIGAHYVLTTRHQGGGVGTVVQVGGVNYTVAQVWNAPLPGGGDPNGAPDLRVARLAGADFSDVALINHSTNDVNWNVTMGGYGKGRGSTLSDPLNGDYGYTWSGDNTILRWGENQIVGAGVATGTYTSSVLGIFFDAPYADPLPHEAAAAEYDSGGGWFHQSGGNWYVAGLTRGAEHYGASWFDDFSQPTYWPDENDAVRVSSYANWIASIPEPATMTLLVAGAAMLLRARTKRR